MLPDMTFNLNESKVPLYDLGVVDKSLEGVLSVGYDEDELKKYMSDLYLDEETVNNQSYDLVQMYKHVFSRGLQYTIPTKFETALEIGAGYGSATYAMAELYPDMKIVASDLSVNMLRRHKKEGISYPSSINQIVRCQINADEETFKDNSFDLVFGSAILHHVFDPLSVIRDAGRVLKKYGVAIFAEPFEAGHALMRIAYEMVLMLNRDYGLELTSSQKGYMQHTVCYWDTMIKGASRTTEELHNLDDKWLFPYSFFDEASKLAGFKTIYKIPISPIFEDNNMVADKLKVHASGNNIQLPPVAMDIASIIDNCFSTQQKQQLFPEGILVMQK